MKYLKQFGIILDTFFHRRIVKPRSSTSCAVKHLWNYIDVHLFKNWTDSTGGSR